MSHGLWSRFAGFLVEASPHVEDVAERRRARLLAALTLTEGILLFFAAAGVASMGEAGAAIVAALLATSGIACLGLYALSRTRHVRSAIWGTTTVLVAIPLVILAATRTQPGVRPFECAVYLLTSVLVGSTLLSVRGAIVTCAVAVGCVVVMSLLGPPVWGPELFHGGQFVATHAALIIVFKVHRNRIEADRAAELRCRNEELEELRRSQEQRISERTAELSAQAAAMRQLLDNVDQGLFTVDRDGTMSPEVSATLIRWFGRPKPEEKLFDYLGGADLAFGQMMEVGWLQVADQILPPDVCISQLPKQLELGDHVYRFSYELIAAGESPRYLVVVSDVTAAVDRERLHREKNETLALFEHFLADKAAVGSFVEEGDASVAMARPQEGRDLVQVRRAVHTLKGNAAMFGLEGVAIICHAIESEIDELGMVTQEGFGRLLAAWAQVKGSLHRFAREREGVIEISPDEFGSFKAAITGGSTREELLRAFISFGLEPVERRLRLFEGQVHRIASGLGKRVEVTIEHDGLRLAPRRWGGIWSVLVHAIRNAVDHGIETPEARLAAGKQPAGTVRLSACRRRESVVIAVEDDGRGVDRGAVKEARAAVGLAAEPTDLVSTLVRDDFSTAARTTMLSGRGVGMGEIARAVRALGGTLSVTSEPGNGTRVEIVAPYSAAYSVPPPMSLPRAHVPALATVASIAK